MNRKLHLAFGALLIFMFTTSTRAQDIEAIGNSCMHVLVPNELETQFANNSEAAFRDSLCGDWFASHREQVEGQGEVNFLVVSVGGSGESQTQRVTRAQYCQNRNFTATTNTRLSFWSRVVPTADKELFNECVSNFLTQLRARTPNPVEILTTQAGDAGVAITIRWDRNVSTTQPRFNRFDTSNINCPQNAIRSGTRIPVAGLTARCTWGNNFPTHGLVIAQTRGGGSVLATVRRETPRLGTINVDVTRMVDRIVAQDQLCGAVVRTPNLHEVRCGNGCACPGDARHCHRNIVFQIAARGADTRIHSPRLICQDDNQLSCAWNAVGDVGRLSIIRNNGSNVEVQRLFGSRDIGVRLCVTEDRHANVAETTTDRTFEAFEGMSFVAAVPTGATGVLRFRFGNNQEQALQVGSSDGRLQLLNRAETPEMVLFTYLVAPLSRRLDDSR